MKTSVLLITIPLAAACASTSTTSAVTATSDSGIQDTIRARKIEIVDGAGRPRIVMQTLDEYGVSCLRFVDAEGEALWSAAMYDGIGGDTGMGAPFPGFLIHGEVGDALYDFTITPQGCELRMGDLIDDEGGIGLGYAKGEGFVTISAQHETKGIPSTAQIKLSLVGNLVIVRDKSGKELISFPAPVYDEDAAVASPAKQGTLHPGTLGPPEKSKK